MTRSDFWLTIVSLVGLVVLFLVIEVGSVWRERYTALQSAACVERGGTPVVAARGFVACAKGLL